MSACTGVHIVHIGCVCVCVYCYVFVGEGICFEIGWIPYKLSWWTDLGVQTATELLWSNLNPNLNTPKDSLAISVWTNTKTQTLSHQILIHFCPSPLQKENIRVREERMSWDGQLLLLVTVNGFPEIPFPIWGNSIKVMDYSTNPVLFSCSLSQAQ